MPNASTTTNMASVGTLEDEARKRKERLKNLRNRTAVNKDETQDETAENREAIKLPKPVFRSYKPADESLKESVLPKEAPIDVRDRVKDQLEAAKTDKIVDEVDLINLAPRKPDWDLKRDVAKKLEKLERRTQRAIAELIRERLKSGSEDLAQVVSAGGAQSRNMAAGDEDDDEE